ncbi:Ig-like domain-containing protein [Saccharobesus litoralis]|nr:tandem-95 repeat protein [Saccharobesus litoralis]
MKTTLFRLFLFILLAHIFKSHLVLANSQQNWQWIKLAGKQDSVALHPSAQRLDESYLQTDVSIIKNQLTLLATHSDSSALVITLPAPNNQTIQYKISYSPIYASSFHSFTPSIYTFKGTQVGAEQNTGRFDIGELGFNGMYQINGELYFIDAIKGSPDLVAFYPQPKQKLRFVDSVIQHFQPTPITLAKRGSFTDSNTTLQNITYRIAIASSAEYTDFFGSVSAAQNAIVTTMNRVNQVYQQEFGIQFQLIANNSTLLQTNANTDPFANSPEEADLTANQTLLDTQIGDANYDIGHVFLTGNGGLAGVGVTCLTGHKASAATGLENPTGDVFAVELASHEIGHQMGANHSFNGTDEFCDGSRNASTAYETGSGSSIMSYAGICDSQNIESGSLAFFHSISLDEINNFVNNGAGATCGNTSNSLNHAPISNAGQDFTIPANTPFVLTGNATDADNDVLTYSWEQFDKGLASSSPADMIDDGTRPLFRAYQPGNSKVRYFPRLQDVIDGNLVLGETYPLTDRTLNFRFLSRDNKGGIGDDSTQIQVEASAGPFTVTSPAINKSLNGNDNLTINWQVANTDQAPISCSQVDIMLSTDNGITFTQALTIQTANDGNETVTVPNIDVNQARVMVKCSDNVFYNIAPARLSISNTQVQDTPDIRQVTTKKMNQGDNITLSLNDVTIDDNDSTVFTLNVLEGNNYQVQGTTVIPNDQFSGSLSVGLTVSDESNNTSSQATMLITINALPTTVDDVASLLTGQTLKFDVLANDNDTETANNLLQISQITYTGPHSVSQVNNQIQIVASDTVGADSLIYTVSDTDGGTATGQLSFTVAASNTKPIIQGVDNLTTNEDMPITLSINQFTTQDTENDALSLIVLNGDNYTVQNNQITPANNFNGNLTVSAKVNDGELDSDTFSFNLTVTPVNDAPLVARDNATLADNTSNLIDVLANDTDIESDPLTLASINYTGVHTVSIENNQIRFNANSAITNETFSYQVSDNQGGTSTGSVTVTVNFVDTVPVLNAILPLTTNEDTAITIKLADLDVSNDDQDPLTIMITAGNDYQVSGTTITPNVNFNGNLLVPIKVNDGISNSNEKLATITVNAINDLPIASNDTASVQAGNTIDINVLANDSDIESNTLTIVDATITGNGQIEIINNQIRYFAPSTASNEIINYSIQDQDGATASASVRVTVSSASNNTDNNNSNSSSGGGSLNWWLLALLCCMYLNRQFCLGKTAKQ